MRIRPHLEYASKLKCVQKRKVSTGYQNTLVSHEMLILTSKLLAWIATKTTDQATCFAMSSIVTRKTAARVMVHTVCAIAAIQTRIRRTLVDVCNQNQLLFSEYNFLSSHQIQPEKS